MARQRRRCRGRDSGARARVRDRGRIEDDGLGLRRFRNVGELFRSEIQAGGRLNSTSIGGVCDEGGLPLRGWVMQGWALLFLIVAVQSRNGRVARTTFGFFLLAQSIRNHKLLR